MPLTEQQFRFAREYAAAPNGTLAYLKAYPGCTYATARSEAARLLADPDVAAEVAAARGEYGRRVRVGAVRVLRELAAVAFADPADAFGEDPTDGTPRPRPLPLHTIPPAARRTIRAVRVGRKRVRGGGGGEDWEVETVEYRFHDKLAALDKLCRHLGLTGNGAALTELLDVLERQGGVAE